MDLLHRGVDASGLTKLQEHWGGTHDTLLGLFTWMHSIPQYSLHRYYSEGGFTYHLRKSRIVSGDISAFIAIHKARNLRLEGNATKLLGQYGLERHMLAHFEASAAKAGGTNFSSFEFSLGQLAAQDLFLVTSQLLNTTAYFDVRQAPEFRIFSSDDCKRKTT